MSFFKSAWVALRSVFVNGRAEDELQEEMAFHLDMQTQHNIEQGMDPVAAKKQALKTFGGAEKLKEDCRDSWGARLVMDLLRDLKLGFRRLKKNPGFALVAIISLGIAIGANTAIFSLLNAILFQTLPVPNPEQLREIRFVGPLLNTSQVRGSSTTLPDGRKDTNAMNHSVFQQLQKSAAKFGNVVGFSRIDSVQARMRGEIFTMGGMLISGNFCEGIGVGAILGRTIRPEDDVVGAEPVALLSYSFWQRQFNGDSNILGELITLNRTGFRVIGVLPLGFDGPQHGNEEDLYVPLSSQPIIQPELELADDNHWWIWVMARLKEGSSDVQLKGALDYALEASISEDRYIRSTASKSGESVTGGGLGADDPKLIVLMDETDRYHDRLRSILIDGSSGSRNRGRTAATPFLFMLTAAGVVLLAACANLAGLLISRSVSQEHETATRKALGAGALRLVRQGMTESFLLAVLGTGSGWIISVWGRAAILQALGSVSQADGLSGKTDYRVFLFTTLLTFLAALLFGLLPALRSLRIRMMDALRTRPESRAGRVFVALQVCLAFLLIVGAGLLIRSYVNIQNINPGFNLDKLLVFQLNAKNGGYEGAQKLDLYQRSAEAIGAIPGVKSVAVSDMPLLANSVRTVGSVKVLDNPEIEKGNLLALDVTGNFFLTLEIPILSGRVFEATDVPDSEKVVIVNESFARTFFGERNPLGKQVLRGAKTIYRVVGVCADTKYNRIKAEAKPMLFFPITQASTGRFDLRRAWIQVKTELEPLALVPAVRQAMATVDPDLPLNNVKTQSIQMNETIFREKFQSILLVVFALMGVFLSCIGTYGLMVYTVSRRTSEIGIRKALGARSGQAIRPIFRSSLFVAGIGLFIGMLVVVPLGALLRDQLYRVEPYDPLTIGVSIVLLLIASVTAAWFPARKAAKISPMEALRVE